MMMMMITLSHVISSDFTSSELSAV